MASPAFSEVRKHLTEVNADPAKALDEKLLESLNGQILGMFFGSGKSFR